MQELEQKGDHMAEDIEVAIYGQAFRIAAGSAEPEYIQRLAAYVDERMRAIAQTVNAASLNRVAVLAALNIADDLLKLQDQHSEASDAIVAKTEHLISLVRQHVHGA
jgi:cell division protein ZapA